MSTSRLPQSRLDLLRSSLPGTVASLHRRHAAEIPAGFIDDYVAIDWLEWNGGTLRLTAVGENVMRRFEQLAIAEASGRG